MNSSETLNNQFTEEKEEYTKAGFLNRVIARTIDFIIVVALYEIIPGIGYFAGLAYLLIADGLFQGRSVGKKLIGLKVVLTDNENQVAVCSYKESIFRNFPFAAAYILFGILGVIPLIGWFLSSAVFMIIVLFESLVMLGSNKGMRLGDELAKTRVVEEKRGGLDVS